MATLLGKSAAWLHHLNPSLSPIPPRADNDGEICFMGPQGTEEGAILCTDIPYSHATCVGSWMLPPEHHILEAVIVTLICLLILALCVPRLYQITDVSHINIQHPPGAPLVSLFCFSMIMYYKNSGYPGRVWYITMPCNMQWALSFIQCWVVPVYWKRSQYTLLQMRLTYIMSVIIAIATPETDDCVLLGEIAFYWFNHFLLLILPAAYVANGSVSCLPRQSANAEKNGVAVSTWDFNFCWWTFSCAVMAVFYFIPVTILAVYSGLNLNFMLHPPHDHFALRGQYFRLTAVFMLAVLFGISRALVLAAEKVMTRTQAALKSSNGSNKQKES